ncbi:MAG: BRCT domain-containing protein [Cyanobacteria bacterium J06635_1]
MGVLSSTLLSIISVVGVLTGYGAIRKERSSGQSSHSGQNLHSISRAHKTLQTRYQRATATNQTLQKQVETLVAEKSTLQKTLDHAWAKTAELEAQLATATEQPHTSVPEQIAPVETQSQGASTDTAVSSLMTKPSLPHNEDAPGATPSEINSTTNLLETAQDFDLSSADISTEKEIETVYEIEAAITIEDSIHDQAISAEPNPLQGKNVSISGTFKDITLAEIKERLQSVGGRLQSHPDANTDYLVVGDTSSDTRQRAEKLKIPQLTEKQFLNLLKESEVLVREEN